MKPFRTLMSDHLMLRFQEPYLCVEAHPEQNYLSDLV